VTPRVVVAAPVFNRANYLESALRSLLDQTFSDLRVLVVDDLSTDQTAAVASRLAAEDERLEVHVNERRLGMLENTNRALTLALQRFPNADYLALGSDHDLWHPRFVERLVTLLDAQPDAVLAYPLAERIDENGLTYAGAKPPEAFPTVGIVDPATRMEAAFRGMAAGNMVYALFRAKALNRRFYRPVLVPDRLLLSELALRGTFAVAPEVLWQRRFRGLAGLDRQRRAFFLDGVPWYARLPWWAQHVGALAWAYVLRGEGADTGIGRRAGLSLGLRYLRLALALRFRRRWGRVRRRLRRWHPRRIGYRVIGRYGDATGAYGRRRLATLARLPFASRIVERRLQPLFERVAERLAGRGPT
jgi:glycosyltransferase involved in cell wall biosynthesis